MTDHLPKPGLIGGHLSRFFFKQMRSVALFIIIFNKPLLIWLEGTIVFEFQEMDPIEASGSTEVPWYALCLILLPLFIWLVYKIIGFWLHFLFSDIETCPKRGTDDKAATPPKR